MNYHRAAAWGVLCTLALALAACVSKQAPGQTAALETPGLPVPYPVVGTPVVGDACTVDSIQYFGLGGENSWSPDGSLLVFQRRDGSGIYQLYTARPDGSDKKCITCEKVPGGPSVDRHKGFPDWHPSGKYIVAQVEMESHPPLKRLTEPGRGAWNNIWVLTPDGQQWFQLTEYPSFSNTGVLNPRFSHDGSKLFWAEKIGRATQKMPFGQWRLAVADFVVEADGPRLRNIKNLRPGDGNFFEAHGFTRDDSKLVFSADIGLPNPFVIDIFTYDLITGELRNLTKSDTEWDEHAVGSPHNRKIAFMSSQCCPGYDSSRFSVFNVQVLQTEEFLMDTDGSNRQQLTHFNTPGFPEYTPEHSVAAVASWSPDGTRLAISQFLVGDSFDKMEARRIWIITFQGECG